MTVLAMSWPDATVLSVLIVSIAAIFVTLVRCGFEIEFRDPERRGSAVPGRGAAPTKPPRPVRPDASVSERLNAGGITASAYSTTAP